MNEVYFKGKVYELRFGAHGVEIRVQGSTEWMPQVLSRRDLAVLLVSKNEVFHDVGEDVPKGNKVWRRQIANKLLEACK